MLYATVPSVGEIGSWLYPDVALCPEAAAPLVGEMGSWLRPGAARRPLPPLVGEIGNETGQQRGVKGPPPI